MAVWVPSRDRTTLEDWLNSLEGSALGDVEAAEAAAGWRRAEPRWRQRDGRFQRAAILRVIGQLLGGAGAVHAKRSAGRSVEQKRSGDSASSATYERHGRLPEEGEPVREQRHRTPNMSRPSRESGVVRGSEIMKNAKIQERAALELMQRNGGDRPARRRERAAGWRGAARNHRAMSARRAALSTTKARPATSAANHTLAPHWPRRDPHMAGDTEQQRHDRQSAGFQICLPSEPQHEI